MAVGQLWRFDFVKASDGVIVPVYSVAPSMPEALDKIAADLGGSFVGQAVTANVYKIAEPVIS